MSDEFFYESDYEFYEYWARMARARRGDPAESRWAAGKVNVPRNMKYVMVVMRRLARRGMLPITRDDLIAEYNAYADAEVVGPQSVSGIRSRAKELTKGETPLLKVSERRAQTEAGNPCGMLELA